VLLDLATAGAELFLGVFLEIFLLLDLATVRDVVEADFVFLVLGLGLFFIFVISFGEA